MHMEVRPTLVFLLCTGNFFTSLGLTFADLSLKNLALHNRRLSRLSEEELFEVLGAPNPENLTRLDGEALGQCIPIQLVESTQWTGWPLDDDDDDEDDEDIRIIDLGEAFDQNAIPYKLAQPDGQQAPETIFTGRFDYRQDLWRVGLMVRNSATYFPVQSIEICCQIYHLVFGELPYSWWGINPLVETMIDVFGELPLEWESKWEQMRCNAAARGDPGAGKWKQCSDLKLEKQFDRYVHEPELKALFPVIQGLTKLLPSERISAPQALQMIRDNCGSIEHGE